jgi:F0F1-type ATP synthase assembly protein I
MNDNNPKTSTVASVSDGLKQGSVIGVQIGCLAVIITIGALLLGLWLDGLLHTSPWLTLALLIISLPISVFVVFRFALRAARRLNERNAKPEDKSV